MGKSLWIGLITVTLVCGALHVPVVHAAGDDGAPVSATDASTLSAIDLRTLRPLYLVTFMKSRTTDPMRTASVVSITNQDFLDFLSCDVAVLWFRGFESTPVCTTTMSVTPGMQTDVCSRAIPDALRSCNTTCAPDLTFHEGKAEVHASCGRLGISARVYYTTGVTDSVVTAISDAKIVYINQGNLGD